MHKSIVLLHVKAFFYLHKKKKNMCIPNISGTKNYWKPPQTSIADLHQLNASRWWKQSASPFGRPTPITELSV